MGAFISAVYNFNFYKNIFTVIFCIFNKYIKIFIIVKNAGIQNFVFRILFTLFFIFINQDR